MKLPSLQHSCVLILMLLSAAASATYYVISLSLPMYKQLPYHFALSISIGIATLAICLEILKPSMVSLTVENLIERRFIAAFGSTIMAIMLILISIWAIDGLLLMLRSWSVSEPQKLMEVYDGHVKKVRDYEAELASYGPLRNAKQVEVDMSKVTIDASILRRTNYCDLTQITRDDSREACAPLIPLKTEMQRLNRSVELSQKLEAERTWLGSNTRPTAIDPQIEMIAKITGLSETFVSLVRWSVLGLVIETVLVLVPALLACRRPRSQFAAPATAVLGTTASTRGVTEQTAKAKLAELFAKSSNAIKTTNVALAQEIGISPSVLSRWRIDWQAQGLINEAPAGLYKLITPGPKWFAAPARLKLMA